MSSSLFVPLPQLPSTIEDVERVVNEAFDELGWPRPRFEVEPFRRQIDGVWRSIFDTAYVIIEDDARNRSSRVTVYLDAESSEDPERPYLASVETRGDRHFAGAVAYAFARYGGGNILDTLVLAGTSVCDQTTLRTLLLAGSTRQ